MGRAVIRVLAVVLMVMIVAVPRAGLALDPVCLSTYIQAVVAGDLDAARACWRPADLARSSRLDIRYLDQPLKVDGDSPLWRALAGLRAGTVSHDLEPPQPVTGGLLAGSAAQTLVLWQDAQTTRFTYHLVETPDGWRLTSPVGLVCERGPARSGAFVTAYDRRPDAPAALPAFLVAQLDSCVQEMAGRLGIDRDRLDLLREKKLGYLLAAPDDVALLAGAPTVGIANLQQDVVVTSHPCHAHELAHLVMSAWLSELPLFTEPLLQEGAAVALGGRWGRHRRVLDRLGRTTLGDDFVALDDLLARGSFLAQGADLSYAPAGVFVSYLLETYGGEKLRAAYLAVSGTASDVAGWTGDDVKTRLARALGTSWDEVASAFAAYVAEAPTPPIRPGSVDAAGDTLTAGDLRVVLVRTDAAVGVTISSPGARARGVILFGGGATAGANALFAEQCPGRPYRGESRLLVFSPQEAKLYDLRTQMLVALHAEGFWPSVTFADAAGRTLRFTVDAALWPAEPAVLAD